MSQAAAGPLSDTRDEELRLALVLNGGVSLAVWMGGVTYELNRLVRETHPVYAGILRLTSTAARIDVISGTSAGGVNGAALALAQIHDTGLYGLRDVWLQRAGLEQLMRDIDDEHPPSVLQGDSYFLPQIEEALAAIAQGPTAAQGSVPLRLSLTSTLMHGIGESRLDDFGAVVEDTTHRARFEFERSDLRDDFAPGKNIVQQLARAARASASFPVAFEPALYDPTSNPFQSKPLKAHSSRTRAVNDPAFLLDGGILDNKPFDAALEGISQLPADGNTRRVIAYIVPDPKAAVSPPQRDAGGKLPPPNLLDVTRQSTVGIPGQQSIADQLAAIREQNDQKRRRWERIVGLLRNTPRAGLLQTARTLFPAYRERRLDGAIDYLLTQLEQGLSEDQTPDKPTLRRLTRQWLRATWLTTADDPTLWGHTIPGEFNPDAAIVNDDQTQWHWGLYALEFMANMVVDVLSRTQRLLDIDTPRRAAVIEQAPDPRLPPTATEDGDLADMDWEALDARPSAVGDTQRAGGSRIGTRTLQEGWRLAYDIARRLRARRERGSAAARDAGRQGFATLLKVWRETPGEQPPRAEAVAMLHGLQGAGSGTQQNEIRQRLRDARDLCTLLLNIQPTIERILAVPRRFARADVAEALKDLGAYQRYFFRKDGDGESLPTVDAIAWRMLALEVIEVGAGSRDHRLNVSAELVQISARLAPAWGGPATPERKLTGMGIAHFAAFYKRSWRANDWIFGRLDGIDRALRIALNPDQLQRLYGQRQVRMQGAAQPVPASEYVAHYIETLAVHGARRELQGELMTAWQRALPCIRKELAWLDLPNTVPPPLLEHCAAALTRRLHLEVLLRELPGLAQAIDTDEAIGASASPAARQLRARMNPAGPGSHIDPSTALGMLRDGLLGADSIQGEVGTDHFTRVVSQAVAVSHATVSAASDKLKWLRVLFKLTEWPIQAFYWAANKLSRDSRTNAALEGAMVGVGAALIAAAVLADKLPGSVTALGWGLLAGGLGATLLRNWRLGLAAVAVSVAFIASINLSATLAAIVFGASLLIVTRYSGSLGAVMLILLAAWWSGGSRSFDVVRMLPCVEPFHWLGQCHANPDAKLVTEAKQLLVIAMPALLVILIIVITNWSRAAKQCRLRGKP